MSKIKSLKVKQSDGSYNIIPIGVDSNNVDYGSISLEDALNNIKLTKSGSNIILTKPNGTSSTVIDSNTTYTDAYIFEVCHPVGSLYWSTTNKSPVDLYGSTVGTWTQIKDKFILAAGDTYTAGSTGGEAAHTLITDEMPSHTHTFKGKAESHSHSYARVLYNTSGDSVAGSGSYHYDFSGSATTGSKTLTPKGTNSSTGGGVAHNNMPPYVVKYCWERTA